MMNALNLLFHRSTLPLSNSLSLSHRCYSTDSCSFTRFTDSFSQYPNANLDALLATASFLPSAPKPTCDALISRGITDRKQQGRSECCPENRAICSDGWKRSNTHTRHAPQTKGSQEGGNKRVFARPKVLQEVHQLYAQQQRPKEESEHPTTKGS